MHPRLKPSGRPFARANDASPDQPSLKAQYAAKAAAACRSIEAAEEAPGLAQLAASAGLSTYHFHRVFKAVTGLTPKDYATAHRTRRVRGRLATSASVTEAIYEAGFNSNSRLYEKSDAMLGMIPSAYRAGGTNTEICFALGECSLGSILVARSPRGVCAILLGDEPEALLRELQDRFPQATLIGSDPGFEELSRRWSAWSKRPASASICRWMCGGPRSSSGFGRRSAKFRPARPRATPTSRGGSENRRRCGR